jgi:hypothetical protein
MRASGPFVVFALIAMCSVGTLGTEACSYQVSGQGGPEGTAEAWDGGAGSSSGGSLDNNGNGSSGGAPNGGSSGGSGTSSGGQPSGGEDASSPIVTCGAGLITCNNGSACCPCPAGQTICGNACCVVPEEDAGNSGLQCPPEGSPFATQCVAYYGAQNATPGCAACITQAASGTCGPVKGEGCTATSLPACEKACDVKLACPSGCGTAQYCECIFDCLSPDTTNTCCGPQTTSFYTCVTGQCASECPAPPPPADAGGG